MSKKAFLLVVLIFGVALIFLFNRQGKENKEVKRISQFENISAQELDDMLSQKDVFLVDVHIPEQNHIEGTDLIIPYNKIKENLDKFPKDKDAKIVVYCRSGGMSIDASNALVNAGYTNVKNLSGGLNAYNESHYELYVSPLIIDLGDVVYGDIAQATFKLINNTRDKVDITKIATSCSCTSAIIDKATLDPYGRANVFVSFNPAIHKDDTDIGNITRTIYLDTTNVNFPRVQASITANVVRQ